MAGLSPVGAVNSALRSTLLSRAVGADPRSPILPSFPNSPSWAEAKLVQMKNPNAAAQLRSRLRAMDDAIPLVLMIVGLAGRLSWRARKGTAQSYLLGKNRGKGGLCRCAIYEQKAIKGRTKAPGSAGGRAPQTAPSHKTVDKAG